MEKNNVLARRAALLSQCPPVAFSNVSLRDAPIHITTWGKTGPSVLMIHGGVQGGLGGGNRTFSQQKPLSMQGWTLRLPDRPGFGQSPSRGPDDQIADAEWIAHELRHGSHLLGHSFGGAEALLAAARRPDAVRSLILIEPALQPMLTTDLESLMDLSVQEGMQIVPKILASAETPAAFATAFAGTLGSSKDGGPNSSLDALLEHPERADALGCTLLQARTAPPEMMRRAADTVAEKQVRVLVISGGYSAGVDAVSAAVARLTRGSHLIIPSPDHFIQQSNDFDFNREVSAFMAAADPQNQGSIPRG